MSPKEMLSSPQEYILINCYDVCCDWCIDTHYVKRAEITDEEYAMIIAASDQVGNALNMRSSVARLLFKLLPAMFERGAATKINRGDSRKVPENGVVIAHVFCEWRG